jgi:hypothetical protein
VRKTLVRKIDRYVWNAEASIELRDLCLSVGYDAVPRGGRKIRLLKPQDWMDDGKVVLDVGKRMRGWFKQQAMTAKPSLGDALKYGLKCDSLPKFGRIPVANIKDITSNKDFPEKDKTEYYLSPDLEKIGYPFKDVVLAKEGTKTRSLFIFYYLIEKPITVNVKIQSFARGFNPEGAKEMLQKLGGIMGIGDGYARGHGCFELKKFKSKVQELNI